MSLNDTVIAIAGPTASGKSALAMRLAKELGGEIVCCDSMQIYRRMDIGTAKPTPGERAAVPHHMVDICEPDTPFSCADYAQAAAVCVKDILSRGRTPVICGGTGLYLEALLFSRPWQDVSGRTDIRDRLSEQAQTPEGRHALWCRLNETDPASAAKTHENNVRRVIRALEIYETTGKTKTELESESGTPLFNSRVLVLHRRDRGEQNRRIEIRAEEMLKNGLIEETGTLLDAGVFDKNLTAAQAIGYKEILGYIRGEFTLEAARERLIIATRQYAKRQDTWFASKSYAKKIEITAEEPDPYEGAKRMLSDVI